MPAKPNRPATNTRTEQMRALRDAILSGRKSCTQPRPVVERPIAFNQEMVRALLAGRKTQTRRLVRPAAAHTCGQFNGIPRLLAIDGREIHCNFGMPGDRLWVRERRAMSRSDCRIVLEIVDVRPQRLADVDRIDAEREGFDASATPDCGGPLEWFRSLWERIYTTDGTRWADNPWVWRIEFRRAQTDQSPRSP